MGIFSKVVQKSLDSHDAPEEFNLAEEVSNGGALLRGKGIGNSPVRSTFGEENGTDFPKNGHSNGNEVAQSRTLSAPPDFIRDFANAKIGKPLLEEAIAETEFQKSASTAQTASKTGTALSGKSLNGTVGATLEAGGLTRPPIDCPELEISAERVEPHLVAITQPRSPFCEEYRSLRTSLIQNKKRKNIKAVVISSTLPGEGKTTTTLNLAWLLAQTDGIRALVIDSDLRLPSLDDYLGIHAEKGLSDVLDGELPWEETLLKLNPAGLYLMPGGTPRDDVAEQLSGPKFKKILDEAREMFDFIIIDAPPLGIFTDAAVLTDYADGAILVIKAGKARYSRVTRLLEVIPKDRMLGVVLNCSEQELEESHYYYYEKERIKNTVAA